MIYRPILQVDGPPAAGKTTLVEALLRAATMDVICMRAVCDKSARRPSESRPRAHPELRRYLAAGATGVALYRFREVDSDAFYTSDFMMQFSEAVIIEGDRPLEWAELLVFVVRPSAAEPRLLTRAKQSRQDEHERSLAALEGSLQSPEALASLLLGGFGDRAVELALKNPASLERMRGELAQDVARIRRAGPPAPKQGWAVSAAYRGVERAQVVVVNARDEEERRLGERIIEDVKRLRADEEVFRDIFRYSGTRTPITAVVADLGDPRDPGLRKALTRIRRALKTRE